MTEINAISLSIQCVSKCHLESTLELIQPPQLRASVSKSIYHRLNATRFLISYIQTTERRFTRVIANATLSNRSMINLKPPYMTKLYE